ncbi:MAG TPA: HAD-IB family hydrolase [Egibacteraceae bacterium]|nr:HAD-IB family hydrolase [Egibacteraceae bacterium]
MIQEALGGKRVLVTGVTGFIGQAVVERLLADLPDTEVAVLVRPRARRSGRQRLERLLDQPAFASWRQRVGDEEVARTLDERVIVVEGGIGPQTPELPPDLAAVIHCAATVSFDPPIDEAFTVNVSGAIGLYEAVARSSPAAHLVHVSTAYVAGVRKGVVHETSLDHDADWRVELDAALAARADVERASRRPEVLDRCMEAARREHGRAGPQAVATDAERRRRDQVTERLVDYGRARAASLGWPDVYTLTKALGERAVEELAAEGGLPLSIVRPSVVESALRHPYPGWIEGFKMAEPIILAYGRGALPEFPAVPDGVIDIIPVDFVANALIAAAASPPEPARPAYYHVSSGARNPLAFRELYDHVRAYFERDPLPDSDRGAVALPEWRFPGRVRVERLLRTGEQLVEVADRVLERVPRSARTREWLTKVHRERRRVEFMRRYADLYGSYTEAEVRYTDDAASALHRSLPPGEQEAFGFDARDIDWRHYLEDVHCPAVSAALRQDRPRSRRARSPEPAGGGDGVLAVFDLEGTILSSNVVESYVWLRLAELPQRAWPSELAGIARALPGLLAADRRDRGEFLRAFYRHYEGATVEGLARLVEQHVADLMLRRAAPAAVRRVRHHRAVGHRTVLVTGALEPLVEPLRPLFDEVVATRLAVDPAGVYTGYLSLPPLVGEARAAWLRRRAGAAGDDLTASWAYGDSHSDLPLLEAVGNPVAVNPDHGLYRVARRRRWPVEEWPNSGGTPRLALPGMKVPV